MKKTIELIFPQVTKQEIAESFLEKQVKFAFETKEENLILIRIKNWNRALSNFPFFNSSNEQVCGVDFILYFESFETSRSTGVRIFACDLPQFKKEWFNFLKNNLIYSKCQ